MKSLGPVIFKFFLTGIVYEFIKCLKSEALWWSELVRMLSLWPPVRYNSEVPISTASVEDPKEGTS